MSITQALVAPRYRSEISTPKTDKSMRAITLDTETVVVPREHRENAEARYAAAGIAWDDERLVFTDHLGESISRHCSRSPSRP
jgi:hypothetical protein